MRSERSDMLHRREEILNVITAADRSPSDGLLSDRYRMSSYNLSFDEACNETPMGAFDFAFSEPSETLIHSESFESSHCPPETHVGSGRINEIEIRDMIFSVSAETACNDSSLFDKQSPLHNNTSKRSNGPFVKWKPKSIDHLQPKKSQFLLKRCIGLLKDIDNHKIVRPPVKAPEIGSTGCSPLGSKYDKLAIHHVIAERKRREKMKEIFSGLRELIPLSPKKGRATVLQHTKDYVIHLKRRIEELERRNHKLEELLDAQCIHK